MNSNSAAAVPSAAVAAGGVTRKVDIDIEGRK